MIGSAAARDEAEEFVLLVPNAEVAFVGIEGAGSIAGPGVGLAVSRSGSHGTAARMAPRFRVLDRCDTLRSHCSPELLVKRRSP